MIPLSLRPYRPSDAEATAAIFLCAICEVAARDYAADQIEAWARIDDRAGWAIRRGSRPCWVAELASKPVGFADLMPDGYIDMMFVHPSHQGLGVASFLLDQVEREARALGLVHLQTDASITAHTFFERRGFHVLREQHVEKRGVTLRNFRMEKRLGARNDCSEAIILR